MGAPPGAVAALLEASGEQVTIAGQRVCALVRPLAVDVIDGREVALKGTGWVAYIEPGSVTDLEERAPAIVRGLSYRVGEIGPAEAGLFTRITLTA
jgi:hypothetical protein